MLFGMQRICRNVKPLFILLILNTLGNLLNINIILFFFKIHTRRCMCFFFLIIYIFQKEKKKNVQNLAFVFKICILCVLSKPIDIGTFPFLLLFFVFLLTFNLSIFTISLYNQQSAGSVMK